MAHGETARAATDILSVNLLDPQSLIQTFGLFGVYLVIFVETGLFFGFFLPGDSLLFVAGVATSPVAAHLLGDHLSLPALMVGVPIAAIAGAQLGHYLGARFGRALFDRPESRVFKAQYVEKAELYFNRFGPAKAVVLARFIPVVRAFLNPVAGILEMPARRFFVWNVVGGIAWTEGILLLGNRLGGVVPPELIDKYLLPVVAVILVISVLPMAGELIKGWRQRRTPDAEQVTETTSRDPQRSRD